MGNAAFNNYKFFIGYMRYGGGWLAGASYDDYCEGLAEAFDDLDAGDFDAAQAFEYIKENAKFYSHSDTPSQAIRAVEQLIEQYIATI
ncbi:hypothetical protein [Acinetobacter soli]|uniref:hypothetical protein n=1 Tax=Acinetobacter soli TaxID=487316 RepID=UPI0012505E5C|nr:hypothetical protein [Acinetobacter soli]